MTLGFDFVPGEDFGARKTEPQLGWSAPRRDVVNRLRSSTPSTTASWAASMRSEPSPSCRTILLSSSWTTAAQVALGRSHEQELQARPATVSPRHVTGLDTTLQDNEAPPERGLAPGSEHDSLATSGHLKLHRALSVEAFGATDLDDDGFVDTTVMTRSGGADINVFLNQGDGTFVGTTNTASAQQRSGVVYGDLNGDDHVDIVSGGRGSAIRLLGNGDGTFGSTLALGSGETRGVGIGHFDDDENLDVAVVDADPMWIQIYPGNGDGTFGTAVGLDLGVTGEGFLAAEDFNGDGTTDVAVSAGGAVQVLLGNGAGGLEAPTPWATSGNSQQDLGTADLDGDGNVDLLVSNGGDGTVTVLLGAGDGTFPTAVTTPAAASARHVRAGDLDGDGRLDLVVAGSPSGDPDPIVTLLSTGQ